MHEEFCRLLDEYNKSDSLFDERALYKAGEIFSKYFDIKENVSIIRFLHGSNINGRYDCIDKNIDIFIECIINQSKQDYFDCSFLDNVSFTEYVNCRVLKTLFHELRHALQFKDIFSGNLNEYTKYFNFFSGTYVNPKNNLMKMGITEESVNVFLANSMKTKQVSGYYCRPIERDAEFFANDQVSKIVSYNNSTLFKFFEMGKVFFLLNDYEKSLCSGTYPFYNFMLEHGCTNIIKQMEWYDLDNNEMFRKLIKKYRLEDILVLGLPVSDDVMALYANQYDSYLRLLN